MSSRTNALGDVPKTAQRVVLGSVLLYFALFVYASIANDATARVLAYVMFGLIAIGVGALFLYQIRTADRGGNEGSIIALAGISLVAGGLAQLGWLATGELALELVSTVAVVVGMGLYVYEVWIAS